MVALVYDGLCSFEFSLAVEIFAQDRPELGEGWYRFASAAVDAGPMRAMGGLSVTADHTLDALAEADLIIIPGWRSATSEVPEDLKKRLVRCHKQGARIASICSGAFVLAACGLLDGRVATTHWRYAEALRASYPCVEVDERRLYSDASGIWTSAGSAAGIDMLLEIVRRDFGADAANSVARRLVLPAHRSGGQTQFIERPVARETRLSVAPLLDTIRENLSEAWPIDRMAREAGLSRRTFERKFGEATGQSPNDWLTAERVDHARRLLAANPVSIEEIAYACGFGSAQVLRKHFRARVGISPTAYRRGFMAADANRSL